MYTRRTQTHKVVVDRKMISVIVPIYNVERYLRQCIDSILCQTYRDLEILLIDDGSQDSCGEICDEYAKRDNRIRVFHTKNNGLSAARNLGLRRARGEFIGFVDSDDWIESNMYESLLRQLEKTGADISNCGAWREYQKNRYDYNNFDGLFVERESIHALILGQISNAAWNKLYKRNCWSGICFPDGHNHEELATIYKNLLKAHSVSCIPDHLYHYRMREGSIVHTSSMNNLKDYWIAAHERYLNLSKLPEIKNDKGITDKLEKLVANAAFKSWRWIYGIPYEQRDYDFLQQVSSFIRKNYPMFGKKNWGLLARASVFFSRHINEFSFFLLYKLNRTYRFFQNINKTPFPQ